jgi:hypothetical protein
VFNQRSVIAISIATLGAVACAGPPEQAVLTQFFTAARLRDTTALAGIATVTFEPHIDGIVTEFDVAHGTAEMRTSFTPASVNEPRDEAKANHLILQLSMNVRPEVDITKYDGEIGSKVLTIQAPVKLPDGRIVQRTLIVTLQRAVLKGDQEMVGRWIITGIR